MMGLVTKIKGRYLTVKMDRSPKVFEQIGLVNVTVGEEK